jgi:hypothetical protein
MSAGEFMRGVIRDSGTREGHSPCFGFRAFFERELMRYARTIVFMLCMLLPPAAGHALNDSYRYPVLDSYESTIMGTPDRLRAHPPEKMEMRRLYLKVIPGLKMPKVFYYEKGLRCTLAYQRKKAPLVFLISGTGGDDQSSKLMAMTGQLYKAGFHVITLPSPTHPNFIICASRSHIPGNPAEDAEDLYHAMETAWDKVKGDIEVSGFYLSGYSLGGTHSAFVARVDEERKVFNFRRVLMVNPAVNLYNSVSRIEGLLDTIPGGQKRIGAYLNSMLNRFSLYFFSKGDSVDMGEEFLYDIYNDRVLTYDEAGSIIGLSFRLSLAGMIFASDVMTNGGYVVPKNRVLKATDPLGDYFLVSMHLSFHDYISEYFFPAYAKLHPGVTRDELIGNLGLKVIEGYLRSSSKISVVTNADDFILSPGEVRYLRDVFGDRATIYPRGGHLGNLEFRDNMAAFVAFFNEEGGARP